MDLIFIWKGGTHCCSIFSYELFTHESFLMAYHDLIQMTFLPTPSMRRMLAVPTQDRIDFRAACFCHKTIVDVGFVCSVCLSSMFFFSKFSTSYLLQANFSLHCVSLTPRTHLMECRVCSFLPAGARLFHMPVRTVSYSTRTLYLGPISVQRYFTLNPMSIISMLICPRKPPTPLIRSPSSRRLR